MRRFILIFFTLLSAYSNIFSQNSNAAGDLELLLEYANTDNVKGLRELISRGNVSNFIDFGDDLGHNALIIAASKGYKEFALMLLSQNINLNLACAHGKTALIYASDSGYVDMVSYLLAKNANPNIKIDGGTTALLQASGKGYYGIVETLIKADADLRMSGTYTSGADDGVSYNMTPLMAASFNNHDLIVKLLLDNGADVDNVNEYGANALFYAIARGNEEVARILLERGAEANISASYESYSDITPLSMAAYLGLNNTLSSLLIGKAEINRRAADGRTALIWAAISSKKDAVFSLINAGADLNIADNEGKTALMYAAENGDYLSAEYLINAGADLNIADKLSKTALMYAMENGNLDIVDLITKASLADNFNRN